ncbi:MAG: endonuclease III domain-containing protein [Gemmatimonadota bacterium]
MIETATRTRRSTKRRDPTERIREIERRLSAAYGPAERERYDPLDELVLTILSQSTNDVHRDVAYARLRERFATWDAVRTAPRQQVESAIRPAGLWKQKARAIQEFLKALHDERGRLSLAHLDAMGDDEAVAYLTSFRGVGVKTAACVLCFSLDRPVMPVDTHVHRLAVRLRLVSPKASAERAHEVLNEIVPPAVRFPFHIQLIRHGRRVCAARRPHCSECVVADLCPKVGVAREARR